MGLQERLFAISEIKFEDCRLIEEVMESKMLMTRYLWKAPNLHKPTSKGWRIVTLRPRLTNHD
jgi:hypothetical protein